MILILLLVSLVFIILRDGGYIKLDLYRSEASSSSSTTWSNNIRNVILPNEIGKNSCQGNATLRDIPLLVYCLGYKHGKSGTNGYPWVSVFITGIDHGPLWTPLYKNVAFNCMVPVSRALQTCQQTGDSVLLSNYMISGVIKLKGNIIIKGFCSYRTAERLLAEHVMNSVYNTVRGQLDKQQ